MTSMSYAKYLYTSYYKCDIDKGFEIDHINNNKMDDRIENYQILDKNSNIKKGRKQQELITCICPVCKKEFLFKKRNLLSYPNPCCSRKCGGIKSHWK
jgi:hypothetical protein